MGAIAADTRFGLQQQTVACDFEKVFKMSDRIFVGLAGLATDVQTLRNTLKFKLALYELREERVMKPEAFSALLSHMLYEKRFGPYFVEPVVAGLTDEGKPFLCGMDLIGAPVYTDDFVVSGTCTPNLNGMCESMYRPDMEPDESSRRSPRSCWRPSTATRSRAGARSSTSSRPRASRRSSSRAGWTRGVRVTTSELGK